jgi:hypothetical protein
MRDSGFSILEICPFSDFGFYSFSVFHPPLIAPEIFSTRYFKDEKITVSIMSTLNQSELFEIAECRRKSALIDWLRENGIKYTYSRKGRVVSTEEQINIALAGKDREEVIEFGAKS